MSDSPSDGIGWGPHECPYDADYSWWRTSDGMFVAGHHVFAVCGYCGAEMALDDLVDGQSFLFVCPACTTTATTHDDREYERSISLEVAPVGPLALDDWNLFARGGLEAETEVLDDAIRATVDVDSGPDAFMLRSSTLFNGGDRRAD